jgi:hypothetical protein
MDQRFAKIHLGPATTGERWGETVEPKLDFMGKSHGSTKSRLTAEILLEICVFSLTFRAYMLIFPA